MYILMYIEIMIRSYSIAEARSRLPAIIDQAAGGAAVEITRRGKTVAALVSMEMLARVQAERRQFGVAYRSFLERHRLDVVGLTEAELTTTRSRSAGRKVSL